MTSKRRRWNIGLLAASALLLAVSARAAWGWSAGMQAFAEWQTARPCQVQVNFDRVGTTRTPFDHTCPSAHASRLLLTVDPPLPVDPDATVLPGDLGELEGEARLRDVSGQTLWKQALQTAVVCDSNEPAVRVFSVADLTRVPLGRHTLEVTIGRPATSLAGRSQTLTASYWLCGMEALPAALSGLLSLAAGGLGLGLGLIAAIVRRGGVRRTNNAR